MLKTIYLLNVDDYAPEITALTYPLIRYYADRIGAGIYIITERKFPEWPVVYEKLQIHELAQRRGEGWSIYIDSDALVHPECIDFTDFLSYDTVLHHGADPAMVRWKYDKYFRRDGRNIGSCNWFTVASDWCLDLWKPLDDLSFYQAVDNIRPTVSELGTIITPEHLIDDYTLSRNIAKYGLKFTTVSELASQLNLGARFFFWHLYTLPIDEKVKQMREVLKQWNLPERVQHYRQ